MIALRVLGPLRMFRRVPSVAIVAMGKFRGLAGAGRRAVAGLDAAVLPAVLATAWVEAVELAAELATGADAGALAAAWAGAAGGGEAGSGGAGAPVALTCGNPG